MGVVRGFAALPRGLRLVATVGAFDGLHRGHQRILGETVRTAAQLGAASVVVTFEPHPDAVIRGRPPLVLCDEQERLARMLAAGIDHVVVQRFDRRLAALTAEEFLDRVGRGRDLAGLVMTPETAFGRDRHGTAVTLARLAAERGFRLVEAAPLALSGERVSSSRIRAHVEAGRLAAAAHLLGRRHAVMGTVVRGDGRGRDLGYPTANLAFAQPVVLPPDGIYAVAVGWAGPDPLHPARRATGVASLGVRPTFGGGERVLEVYLFDVSGSLYGERLRVEFVRRQRGQRRFRSVAALVAQMDRDAAAARRILAAAEGRKGAL
jgi:riboflavin kinase/FMN adenylyltransferase